MCPGSKNIGYEGAIPIHFKFKKQIYNFPKTIGVCGANHGAGATHVALALSNYLCSKEGLRVAYLELSGSHDICNLSGKSNEQMFKKCRIHLYPDATKLTLDAIAADYDVLVLDLGVLHKGLLNEYQRCDLRLVIGDLSCWRQHYISEWIRLYGSLDQIHPEATRILGNGMGTKERTKSNLSIPISEFIPNIPNPFHLTSSEWSIFEALFTRK